MNNSGGINGMLSGDSRGFEESLNIRELMTTAAPVKIGSKANWLLHCLGVMMSSESGTSSGKNTSGMSFKTIGNTKNCSE